MMSITHTAFGLFFFGVVGAMLGAQLDGTTLVAVFIGSILPDIDHPRSALGIIFFPLSRWINSNYGHRTATHSAQFVLLSCAVFLLFPFAGFYAPLAFVLGVISHLIADGMNVSGVPLQYPNTRPFYFLPKKLLVKTGSAGEFAYLIIFIILAGATTGMSYMGFRTAFHVLFPSYQGVFDEFCKDCAGEGHKKNCFVEAYICAQYYCGEVSGKIMGIWGKDLVIRSGPFDYYYLDEFNVRSIKLDVNSAANLTYYSRYFRNENLTFDYQAYSVSGKIYGKFECAQCRDYYPAFIFSGSEIQLNWFAGKDLEDLNITGKVDSGYLTYQFKNAPPDY